MGCEGGREVGLDESESELRLETHHRIFCYVTSVEHKHVKRRSDWY